MTIVVPQPLPYASPTRAATSPARRFLLWALYYLCWSLSAVVPATAGVGYLFETFRPKGADNDLILIVGPSLGVAAGMTVGHLFRHRRWLHALPFLLGGVTLVLGAVMTHAALNEPHGFLWELVVLFYTAVALSGLALCTAGASGFALSRPVKPGLVFKPGVP